MSTCFHVGHSHLQEEGEDKGTQKWHGPGPRSGQGGEEQTSFVRVMANRAGVPIEVSVEDVNGNKDGIADFTREYLCTELVTLVAPDCWGTSTCPDGSQGDCCFDRWVTFEGVVLSTDPFISINTAQCPTVVAVYICDCGSVSAGCCVNDGLGVPRSGFITVSTGTGGGQTWPSYLRSEGGASAPLVLSCDPVFQPFQKYLCAAAGGGCGLGEGAFGCVVYSGFAELGAECDWAYPAPGGYFMRCNCTGSLQNCFGQPVFVDEAKCCGSPCISIICANQLGPQNAVTVELYDKINGASGGITHSCGSNCGANQTSECILLFGANANPEFKGIASGVVYSVFVNWGFFYNDSTDRTTGVVVASLYGTVQGDSYISPCDDCDPPCDDPQGQCCSGMEIVDCCPDNSLGGGGASIGIPCMPIDYTWNVDIPGFVDPDELARATIAYLPFFNVTSGLDYVYPWTSACSGFFSLG